MRGRQDPQASMPGRSRRREVVVRLDQEIYELLVREADCAERIVEQHASFLVKRALLAQAEGEIALIDCDAAGDGRVTAHLVAQILQHRFVRFEGRNQPVRISRQQAQRAIAGAGAQIRAASASGPM